MLSLEAISAFENELDGTIEMLMQLRSADYGFDVDVNKFIRRIEERVHGVVSMYEPLYEILKSSVNHDPSVMSVLNRLVKKYNRMLNLCEPR